MKVVYCPIALQDTNCIHKIKDSKVKPDYKYQLASIKREQNKIFKLTSAWYPKRYITFISNNQYKSLQFHRIPNLEKKSSFNIII